MSWWRQFERLSCLCYLIIVLSVHWVCLFCSQIKTRGCIWLLFEIIYLDSCLNSFNLIIAINYSIMFFTWIFIEVYQTLLVSFFIFQSTIRAGLAIINYQDSCFTLGFTSCLVSTPRVQYQHTTCYYQLPR